MVISVGYKLGVDTVTQSIGYGWYGIYIYCIYVLSRSKSGFFVILAPMNPV